LPADQRVTRSNAVRKPDDLLLASGLIGPVVLQRAVSSNDNNDIFPACTK